MKLFALVLVALIAYLPTQAHAAQDVITTPGMTTLSRLGSVSIDVHGKGCKSITNRFQTSDDLFIPFGSKEEWESFLDYADSTGNIDVGPCPIAYGEWSYVGSCSATCGGGTIVQTRSCVYTPTGQTLDCSYCGGECSQTVECNTTACAEWDRTCAAPAWNTANRPATCGQSCTVTCEREGVPVSGSQCTGTPPADYIASTSCTGCAPGSTTQAVTTVSCSKGGLGGTGTIDVRRDIDCNGAPIPGTGHWVGVSGCCVPNVPANQTQQRDSVSIPGCTSVTNSCTTPWGATVAHGGSVLAYPNATVPFGQTCQAQTRTCNNGVLSGTATNQYCTVSNVCPAGSETKGSHTATCAQGGLSGSGTIYVDDVRDCKGNIIPGRGTWTSVVGCCVAGLENTRTQSVFGISVAGCDAPAPRSCTTPWGATVAHGGSVTAHAAATVPFGQTCQSQTRTCNNGSLSGSYTNRSCSAGTAASCSFNGQTIVHGGAVTAYATSTVAYGQTCQSQTRTCNNGSLSGSYTHTACSIGAAPVGCLNEGKTVGTSPFAYQDVRLIDHPSCGCGAITGGPYGRSIICSGSGIGGGSLRGLF